MLTADEAVFRFSNAEGFPTKNPKSLHIVSYCNHASNSYSMLFLLVSSLKFLPKKTAIMIVTVKTKVVVTMVLATIVVVMVTPFFTIMEYTCIY